MSRCIANSSCSSGFCKEGYCTDPDLDEPCSGNNSCRGALECSRQTRHCVHNAADRPNKPCMSQSDCTQDQYCHPNGCRHRGNLNDGCDSDRLCKDGLLCMEEHGRRACVKRCHINENPFRCPSGYMCSVGHDGFDGCLKDRNSSPQDSKRCLFDRNCATGFCKEGYCASGQYDDPCSSSSQCVDDLVCASRSKRCTHTEGISPNKPCINQNDCTASEYCNLQSGCKTKQSLGSECTSDMACEDGHLCMGDGSSSKYCRKRCHKDESEFGCGADYACKTGHGGFDGCIPLAVQASQPSASSSPPPNDSSTTSTYLWGAGIGLGVGLVVLAIALGVWFLVRHKRGGKRAPPLKNTPSVSS